MKKLVFYLVSVFMLSLVLNSSAVNAQPNKGNAKQFLNRTNIVMQYAREVVKQNKVYTGDLVKASCHQKLARELFKEGKLKKAIFQSHRARSLAFEAIKANRKVVKPEMNFTDAEKNLVTEIPTTAQLDAEVTIPTGATDESAVTEQDEEVN
jgi:hypothetical protein